MFMKTHLAKNIILAGVKSVTVYDPEPVQIQDLSSQASTLHFGFEDIRLTCQGHFSSSFARMISERREPTQPSRVLRS
jgi:hypothetical protein